MRNFIRLVVISSLLSCFNLTGSNNWSAVSRDTIPKHFRDYVRNYAPLAVSLGRDAKIPPAIILAVALLESGAGQSTLSQKANNHFGIKSIRNWEGDTYCMEHKEHGRDTRVQKACFRKYANVEESYIDFVLFLYESERYESLWDLSTTDLELWATALQDLGYATDRHYASKLIRVIKNYRLAIFMNDSSQEKSHQNIEKYIELKRIFRTRR